MSPADYRGGGWDFEPVTDSSSVVRIASGLYSPECGWRRVARVAGSRLQPYRMETCDTEEPDEGKLHVRIRGEAGGESPRLYPDTGAAIGSRGMENRSARPRDPGRSGGEVEPNAIAPCPTKLCRTIRGRAGCLRSPRSDELGPGKDARANLKMSVLPIRLRAVYSRRTPNSRVPGK